MNINLIANIDAFENKYKATIYTPYQDDNSFFHLGFNACIDFSQIFQLIGKVNTILSLYKITGFSVASKIIFSFASTSMISYFESVSLENTSNPTVLKYIKTTLKVCYLGASFFIFILKPNVATFMPVLGITIGSLEVMKLLPTKGTTILKRVIFPINHALHVFYPGLMHKIKGIYNTAVLSITYIPFKPFKEISQLFTSCAKIITNIKSDIKKIDINEQELNKLMESNFIKIQQLLISTYQSIFSLK
jgi:hypothetical protein